MKRKVRIVQILCYFILLFSLIGCKQEKAKELDTFNKVVEEDEKEATSDVNDKDKNENEENSQGKEALEKEIKNKTSVEENKVSTEPLIEYTVVFEEDFEDNHSTFVSRGDENTIITSALAYEGTHALESSKRTQTWHGPKVDVSEYMTDGKRFIVKAYVMYKEGAGGNLRIYSKVEKNSSEYLNVASVMANKGEWILLEGEIQIPNGTNTASVYFETEYKEAATKDDLVNLYIDKIEITEVKVDTQSQELVALKDIYKDYFSIGVAISNSELKSKEKANLITSQFNSITMGNEMKPDNLLNYEECIRDIQKTNEEPVLRLERMDIGLEFARDNGISLRGHTLVWHSQTPSWFFKEGYSKDSNAPFVSKEIMLKRLESYIRQILQYTKEKYPGVIYAWDVVNEGILPGDGESNGYRVNDSLWYQTIGPEYIEEAFAFARIYGDNNVKLFYNDFNEYEMDKKLAIYNLVAKLKEQGTIDGIGMQSHIKMDYPSLIDYENSLIKYGELGLEIHITELDMDLASDTDETLAKQAMRYKRLFTTIKKVKDQNKANITNVTFWGLTDDNSWLNDDTASYPLLFDKYLQAKKAFYGVILDDSIPLY